MRTSNQYRIPLKSLIGIWLLFSSSILTFAQIRNDSATVMLPSRPDTVVALSVRQADSVIQEFNSAADSIHRAHQNTIADLDILLGNIIRRSDSIQRMGLLETEYAKVLDSLNEERQSAEIRLTSKLNALKSETTQKLTSLSLPPEYEQPLQELTQDIDQLDLNTGTLKIPQLDMPGYPVLDMDGANHLTSKAKEITNVDNVLKLPEIKGPLGDATNTMQQAQSYQGEINNIADGNFQHVEKLPETIEQQASKIDGMEEIQKASGALDQHKTTLEDLNNPDKAKEKVVKEVKKAAIDHFAGKQEQLKAAMEKISKYKQKYSSVSSIKDLPKRPPNALKGKPFTERLVPGLYLQYQQKGFYLIDVNPYIGYKISGRFTSGLGWNHRYAFDHDNRSFNSRSRIFGPRAYVDFKLGRGFIAHVEGETMNSFVPPTVTGNPDTGHREWVRSFMMGMKKEYTICKNLKGTALIQYNLFNRYYKAPYVDRLNSRIGFEYVLKSGRKKK